MPILDKNNKNDVARYNEFTRKAPFGKLSQDIRWEHVKKGWEGDYVYLEEGGEIVAALSVLSIKAVDGRYFMYANRGPVSDFHDIATTKKLIAELEPIIKEKNPFLLRLDPECLYDENLVEAYRKEGFDFRAKETSLKALIQPRFNMILNMAGKSEDELLAEFNSKTRYNIRLSTKKGIVTKWAKSKEYIDIFYDLTKIMAERQGITYRPKDYFERMMEVYTDNRIYVSWYGDEPLSAAIAFPYGDKLWYLYGASSNEKRNLMPNHNMQWEMIKWGLELEKTYYDFGGVYHFTSDDGLYRFKNGFCHKTGATEWIGELDLVYDREVYEKFINR